MEHENDGGHDHPHHDYNPNATPESCVRRTEMHVFREDVGMDKRAKQMVAYKVWLIGGLG